MREILDPETTFDGKAKFFRVDIRFAASHGRINVIESLVFEPSLDVNHRTRTYNKSCV